MIEEPDRTVVMLDFATRVLHMPSDDHLVTACEINLGLKRTSTMVGPMFAVSQDATSLCAECFPSTGQ